MKHLFILLALVLISSCSKKAVIEQEFRLDQMCPPKYQVYTRLWIRYWTGHPVCLEVLYRDDVAESEANDISSRQLIAVKKHLRKIEACLSEKNIKVSPKTFAQQPLKVPACSL